MAALDARERCGGATVGSVTATRVPATFDAELLQLYLSDHLSGSAAGLSRVRRMAEQYAGSPMAETLREIAHEIDDEQNRLQRLIDTLGLKPLRHRQVLAWTAEKLGRLKLNGRVLTTSPMTPLLEMELMRSAVIGKLGLWETLTEIGAELGEDPEEFRRYADLARSQADRLGELHGRVRDGALRPQSSD